MGELLERAGLKELFIDVVSVEEVRSFKPDSEVYVHFLKRAGVTGREAWLVSGNPFDVIGAVSAGMGAAWVRRSRAAVFDPWEVGPSVTVNGIDELEGVLREYR